jgi:hypothetical protein
MVPVRVRVLLVLALAISHSGCTATYPLGIANQSAFTSATDRVSPSRNVYGEATVTTFGTTTYVTGKMKEEAIDKALEQVPDANILVDYNETAKTIMIWTPILPIFVSTYSVEGVAAHTEVE